MWLQYIVLVLICKQFSTLARLNFPWEVEVFVVALRRFVPLDAVLGLPMLHLAECSKSALMHLLDMSKLVSKCLEHACISSASRIDHDGDRSTGPHSVGYHVPELDFIFVLLLERQKVNVQLLTRY